MEKFLSTADAYEQEAILLCGDKSWKLATFCGGNPILACCVGRELFLVMLAIESSWFVKKIQTLFALLGEAFRISKVPFS